MELQVSNVLISTNKEKKNLLDREIFGRGMQLLSVILVEKINVNFSSRPFLDVYYMLLKDLPSELFNEGIIELAKNWHNPHILPSAKNIRDSVVNQIMNGNTKQEMESLIKAKKLTGVVYSDQKLDRCVNYMINNNLNLDDISKRTQETIYIGE